MISIIIIIAFTLVAGFLCLKNRTQPLFWIKPVIIAVTGLLIAWVQPYSMSRVDAGHVGIKVNLTGDERGVSAYSYKTGWVAVNIWLEQLYEFPTYQQHIEYDTIMVITKGGFPTTITPSFNYSLVSNSIGDMFTNLRKDIKEVEQGWLKNAILSSVNDVANKWPVDSIFNHRELFESAIIKECNKRVSKWFMVSQLRSNIIPPDALVTSILAKTKAYQDVQVAENQKKVAIAEGLKRVAIAKADSQTQIIKASADGYATILYAKAEAEAMRLKQQQLSAIYVEYVKWTNWDGKMPVTMLGGATPLINIK